MLHGMKQIYVIIYEYVCVKIINMMLNQLKLRCTLGTAYLTIKYKKYIFLYHKMHCLSNESQNKFLNITKILPWDAMYMAYIY